MYTIKWFNVKTKTLSFNLDQNQSNPASMVTTADDYTASLSKNDIVAFTWAYPCLVKIQNNQIVDEKKLMKTNLQKLEDWTDASSLTHDWDYDVMVKFPRRWYKIDWTKFYLTDDPNADWFCYAPFQRLVSWTLWASGAVYSNSSAFYIWAYQWINSSWLRSWYWKTPTASQTIWTFAWYAQTRWTNAWIEEFLQYFYLELLFLAIFKNTNAQSVLARWYVDWSWSSYPWTTWNTAWLVGSTTLSWQVDGCYWVSNWTTAMSFLWIEDRYWRHWHWINGWGQDSNWVHISIPNSDWSNRTSSYSYAPTWNTNIWSISPTSWQYITKTKFTTYGWFTPITTWGSETTYFTDSVRRDSGSRVARFGGVWSVASRCGAFCWYLYSDASYSNANIGARLMFLPNGDLTL